jgi:two-component system cell cycle sensor histidine kinase/response regulator CckA
VPVSEEVRLAESYESMIQGMAEGVVADDKEGMLIFVNLAAARLLGYEPEELVGRHWTAIVPPDQQPLVHAANERRKKGQIDRYQLELINREQVRLPMQVSGSPRFDPETGRFAGSLAILTDIGEQVSDVLAYARLAQVQPQLSTAIEQAAESIIITDAQGNIQYMNPAFERISGYGPGEAIGQNLLSLRSSKLEPAFREPFHKPLQQSFATNHVWQGRIVSQRKDGTVYTEDATITPVRSPSGEIVSYVATMHDVTREIQLEEQFHQAQKMEAVGRLAGGIAHDFNNLLTVINLSTRLLEHSMRPGDPGREHLQRIQESGEWATQLIKQLLTFSRRETLQSQKLNLNQVVEDLSLMLQRIIGEDIKLKIELADDLWLATADPSQMEQVIMNLAVNARDAMPRGGTLIIKTANVLLDAAYAALHVDVQPGDYIVLTISDTGVGMNHEVKSHLFEPFFTTKEQGKGTGLGLATVFGIAKQSRGHIQVYSEVGYGTTFRFYLPRDDDLSAVMPPGQNEKVTRSKGTDSRSPVLHPLSIGV